MNTIGKILVVLNFLFALLVATLVAMSYTTSTNWKNQVEELKVELKVAHANNLAQAQSLSDLASQLQAVKTDIDARKNEIAVRESELASLRVQRDTAVKEAEDRGKNAEVNLEKALAAKERMQQEVVQLKTIIGDREDRIVKLSAKLRDTTDLAMTLDRDLKFSQERNQILVARVQELERRVAELQQPESGPQTVSRDPNALNPPSRFVKGVVERVDSADKTLVKISLGTDHGVKKDNTLEVYRTNPVQYLGVLRIEDAQYHTSVGRLMRTPGVKTAEIREGDIVASGLDSRR
jgi:hypothetical protein